MSAEPQQPAEDPEIDWQPVVGWPSRARVLMKDIEDVKQVLVLLEGTADSQVCQVFTDFLRTVLTAEQEELSLLILTAHDVEVPEPGTMTTPQERMSAQLRHVADEVRKRRDIRPEDVGMRQPPVSRARRMPSMQPDAPE